MKRYICGALLAALPLAAYAGDEADHWYLNPYAGGITPDKLWGGNGATFLYGLDIGKNFGANWAAELDLNGSNFNDRFDSGHVGLYGAALDGLRVWNRAGRFAPYIDLGAGVTHAVPPGSTGLSSRTDFMAQGGVGAFIKLWENADASRSLALRPDVKARWTNVSGNPVDFLYVLGLTFTFGPGRPTMAPAAAPPPPPPPPPPPAPKPVAKCPNVPAGVAVDEQGCPYPDVVLRGVNFETNSDVLTAQSLPVLNEVASGLARHPHMKVELQGYTDSTGSAAYNLGLSQRRADAVREYLIRRGVAADQLLAKGYGEASPVASNATAAGRLSNRRVVMHVLENPRDIPVKDEGKAQE